MVEAIKTGSVKIIVEGERRFLVLTQLLPDKSIKHVDCIELPRARKNKQGGQIRWRDGSYFTDQQELDERYTRENHIA